MSKFIHLNVHSHYSILESTLSTKEIIENAAKDNQKAISLNDSGVLFGAIEFYQYAIDKDIKPIIGMRAFVAPKSRFEKGGKNTGLKNYHFLNLLVKNEIGYKNLIILSSLGYTEGFYHKPRIDKELLQNYSEGLIALSGGRFSEISQSIEKQDFETAEETALLYKSIFKDDFYIELQNMKQPDSLDLLKENYDLAKKLGIEVVATNEVHYLKREHSIAHNILLNIQNFQNEEKFNDKNVLSDKNNENRIDYKNLRFLTDEFYLKSQLEMIELFSDYPDAINNTVLIADKCNLELSFKNTYMPNFEIPKESKSENLNEYLKELVFEGLKTRFDGQIPQNYLERAEFEIEVISNMNFPGYFLIVWDFIKAARLKGVEVGPGRGSAAGSLVAYALEITNIDPIKYDLLFERFLNPDRISMPDIDIDFNDEKRDIVIDYVKNKYGEDSVSQIVTFSKLTTKAVLTDVGRILGINLSQIKEITKKIPVKFGKVAKLKDAIELPELNYLNFIIERGKSNQYLSDEDKKLFDLINYSLVLEDKVRGLSIHAAGVVIAPDILTKYVPIAKNNKNKGQSLEIFTQFSMNELEKAGLLKMDFLGLRTLSIIEKTIKLIKINNPDFDPNFDIEKIDLEDLKTYELFSNGNTISVFQFESPGMQEYLKKLKPQNLEEITAMNALYRPGPMDNIPEFIERKFGRKDNTYLHVSMEDSLKSTYGIIVYQEQVMKLVQDVAGFTLGQADLLRRAMGKKKESEMDKMLPIFVEGAAKKNNIDNKLAKEIFDLIYKFANYGFNKSHSLAYSYLAFQTAWLKTHYPTEFIAANMTAEINSQSKIVLLRDDAVKFGTKILAPDINTSYGEFTVKGKNIYFGLTAIKNVGIPAVKNIVLARKEKLFTGFFDFVSRVDNRLINKRTLESLICSGALDSIENKKRNAMMQSIDYALEYSKKINEEKLMMMDSLFGNSSQTYEIPRLTETPEWDDHQRLKMEKEVLNFYVTGHPILENEQYFDLVSGKTINSLTKVESNTLIEFCGFVSGVTFRNANTDSEMAILELEDMYAKIEAVIYAKNLKKYKDLIQKNELIFMSGKIREQNEESKVMICEEIFELEDYIKKKSTGYKIWLNESDEENLQNLIKLYSYKNDDIDSNCDIAFYSTKNNAVDHKVYYAKNTKIPLNSEYLEKMNKLFGKNNVRFLNYKEN